VLSAALIARSVVPLLVALLNLLVAGGALTEGLRRRSRLPFAAGPAGVGIWALGWFLSAFDAASPSDGSTSHLMALGGVISMAGFALDALRELPRKEMRGLGVAAVALVVTLFFAALGAFGSFAQGYLPALLGRAVGVSLAFIVVVTRCSQLRSADPALARLARASLLVTLLTVGVFMASALALLAGAHTSVDPHLFVVLLSELYTLVYISQHRVRVELLVSHALSYALLSLLVAGLATLSFSLLRYRVDVVVVTVTVAVSLLASALFMGAKEHLSSGIRGVLFPAHARTERALADARTELEALRRRLGNSERLAIAGQLAASVAHEIKNPLAPIRGYAQLLSERLPGLAEADREPFAKGLRIIDEEAERIDVRVRELLELSRPSRPEREVLCDLDRLLAEAIALAEGEPGISPIHQRLGRPLGLVAGAPDDLRGALLNVLKNAAEATLAAHGRSIEVLTRQDGALLIIEVLDQGAGIAADACERAFEAFYTTKAGGTGLGLAIARAGVEAAGGTIEIVPRQDRSGALVRLALPHAPGERRA
jgi:signal transduction histidine kinase